MKYKDAEAGDDITINPYGTHKIKIVKMLIVHTAMSGTWYQSETTSHGWMSELSSFRHVVTTLVGTSKLNGSAVGVVVLHSVFVHQFRARGTRYLCGWLTDSVTVMYCCCLCGLRFDTTNIKPWTRLTLSLFNWLMIDRWTTWFGLVYTWIKDIR